MRKPVVEIVDIAMSKVASAYGYGDGPETIAYAALCAFIRQMGWDRDEVRKHRIFGFNNPDPAPGSGKYGYEFWITVEDSFLLPKSPVPGIELKTVTGGLYASLLVKGVPNPSKWGGVVRWVNGSPYQYDAARQWLEEMLPTAASLGGLFGGKINPHAWEFHLMAPIVPAAQKVE